MNKTPVEQIKKEITEKMSVRKNKKDNEDIKIFSFPSFFAGEEFQQELEKNDEIKERVNVIDFAKKWDKDLLENEIKKIYNSSPNKQFIENKNYPILWFKNINKISSDLEKSLLPIFDSAQNHSLFNGEVNLTEFILIVTSSIQDTGKLSNPLISRLFCVNVDTAKPKEFF